MTSIFTLGKSNALIQTELAGLKLLVVQMSAVIIKECETLPVFGTPRQGAGGILSRYFNWSDSDYYNSIQTMVEFIYDFIPEITNAKYLFSASELELIKLAMVSYQESKNRVVKHQQTVFGPDFGSKTGFAQTDWTDRNHLI